MASCSSQCHPSHSDTSHSFVNTPPLPTEGPAPTTQLPNLTGTPSSVPSGPISTTGTQSHTNDRLVCPWRTSCLPKRYHDELPQPPAPVAVPTGTLAPLQPVIQRVILSLCDTIRTALNAFGIFHEYPYRPLYDPNAIIPPEALTYRECQPPEQIVPAQGEIRSELPPPWPFPNMSVYRLMKWKYLGSIMKSQQEIDRLVHDILLAGDFKAEDLLEFCVSTQNSVLDAECSKLADASDSWWEVNVNIKVPSWAPNTTRYHRSFAVNSFLYHPLIGVMKAAFSVLSAKHFHLFLFKCFWNHVVDGTEQ